MDHGVICTRCRAPVSSRDRMPQYFATCPACSHPAPLKRVIAEGVAVFECRECVPATGLLSKVLGQATVTTWGETEDQAKPVTLAPVELQRLKDPLSTARVDEILLAEREKLWTNRCLTYGDNWIRCAAPACKKYLKRVRGHSGRCQECKAPLLSLQVIRKCKVEDCPEFGKRQYHDEDPFCEHCKSRLEVTTGNRHPSEESHLAKCWAQRVADEGRVEISKGGDSDAPKAPKPVPKTIEEPKKSLMVEVMGRPIPKPELQPVAAAPAPETASEAKREGDDDE